MSDPSQPLVGNPDLLASIQTTDQIAQKLISDTTTSITTTVDDEATHQRNNAIRDALAVLAAFLIVLAIVLWVARSLVRPLRTLRDGALKIAHEDLARGIDRVKAGDEREPAPLPIHTTEEVGQVAHAVDELHAQALLLAGDEARLRVMVNDMFETMSRRNKSLVDQQLSLIDGSSATRRTRTASTACSGSTTLRPGCAATAPTCLSSPAPSRPASTANRFRWHR